MRSSGPLTLASGASVALGPLLGKGGEGEVYEVVNEPRLVLKLYLQPLTPEREKKLETMVRLAAPELTAIAAWPTQTVHRGGHIVGFLMPRLSGHKELHKLSHPMDRLKTFPEAGYDFLVHVATNIARAFSTLHSRGLVVGDVNESGIMVAADGTVMCIDCDSMQVVAHGETFTCDVGKPEFQPPEILNQHKSFRGVLRTTDHDAFGLAVALFQLLFFGWHPFSVRMLDGDQQPTADNIKAGRFPFGRDFYVTDYRRPPHALDPDALPDFVRELIERAFSPHRSGPRPTAGEWVLTLERLSMESVACSRYMTHVHHRQNSRCPFCALDLKLGFAILPHVALDAARLKAVWSQIQAAYFELSAPTPAPDIPLPAEPAEPAEPTNTTDSSAGSGPLVDTHPLAETRRRGRQTTLLQLASLPLIGLGLVHPALFTMPIVLSLLLELRLHLSRPPAFRALRASLKVRRAEFLAAERALRAGHDMSLVVNYEDGKRAFEALQHHDDRRSSELFRLHERLIDTQTRDYLNQHTLRKAGLAAIPGRVVILLEKLGLATAGHVATIRKQRPRGLDAEHVHALTRWEYGLLNRFVPDLEADSYRQALDALHQRLDAEHAQLLNRLVLSRDWLMERLGVDRRKRDTDLQTYRERFTAYAEDLVRYRAAAARWPLKRR